MMKIARQKVMAGVMVFLVSACGFAQGNDNKRPPKPPDSPRVVVKDKDKNDKPPANSNQRDKGKPNH
jgi:hypothetical protein